MNFTLLKHNQLPVGHILEKDDTLYFFGTRHATLETIKLLFSDLEFYALKQIHSNKCVSASPYRAEADAHFTQKVSAALLISTADCIPILGRCGDTVFAVHAGWRGVYNDVIGQTLLNLNLASGIDLFMGPHIQTQSFEVNADLAHDFILKWQTTYGQSGEFGFRQVDASPEKYYLDLYALLIARLQSEDWPIKSIWHSPDDTKTNPLYASHRREPALGLRNLSFVARRR